jgi:hypothetical protein
LEITKKNKINRRAFSLCHKSLTEDERKLCYELGGDLSNEEIMENLNWDIDTFNRTLCRIQKRFWSNVKAIKNSVKFKRELNTPEYELEE